MNQNSISRAGCLYGVFGLIFMISTVLAAGKTALQGRIIGEEDDDGNTKALYLYISEMNGDEEVVSTYYIDKSGKGNELFDYIYETVKVTGTVKKDKAGNNVIAVDEYQIIVEEIKDDSGDDVQMDE